MTSFRVEVSQSGSSTLFRARWISWEMQRLESQKARLHFVEREILRWYGFQGSTSRVPLPRHSYLRYPSRIRIAPRVGRRSQRLGRSALHITWSCTEKMKS